LTGALLGSTIAIKARLLAEEGVMRYRKVIAGVAAAALLGTYIPGGLLQPQLALAACSKEEAGVRAGTSVDANGAKMAWTARALTATDWAGGGFAAQVLWVGTNNSSASTRWVEAGITQGWQGSNILTHYTAHGDTIAGIYSEHRWTTPTVTLGSTYTFAGFYNTTNTYRTTVNAPGGNSWDWSGHTSGTGEWAGGSESTCGPPSKVSKTYVSLNQYRRTSDHVYVNAAAGSLFDYSPNGGSAWCTSPRTFRYWMNDASSGCS
jgi:hypothetical protein